MLFTQRKTLRNLFCVCIPTQYYSNGWVIHRNLNHCSSFFYFFIFFKFMWHLIFTNDSGRRSGTLGGSYRSVAGPGGALGYVFVCVSSVQVGAWSGGPYLDWPSLSWENGKDPVLPSSDWPSQSFQPSVDCGTDQLCLCVWERGRVTLMSWFYVLSGFFFLGLRLHNKSHTLWDVQPQNNGGNMYPRNKHGKVQRTGMWKSESLLLGVGRGFQEGCSVREAEGNTSQHRWNRLHLTVPLILLLLLLLTITSMIKPAEFKVLGGWAFPFDLLWTSNNFFFF